MNCMTTVILDQRQAKVLAFDDHDSTMSVEYDPMLHIHALRLHLYHGSAASKLALLERTNLLERLNKFVDSYRELLFLASTPLPISFLHLSHAFVLLWTFTLPFVIHDVLDDGILAYFLVSLLTYGFIGLEFVSSQLNNPFGDSKNGLAVNVTGIRQAFLRGMNRDLELFGESVSDQSDHNEWLNQTKSRMPTFPPALYSSRKVAPRPGNKQRNPSNTPRTITGTTTIDTAMEYHFYISMDDAV